MKKYLFFVLFFVCCGFVSADTSPISYISVDFCRSDKSLLHNALFVAESGKGYPICLQFLNRGDKNIHVSYDFVDQVVTDDAMASKACGSSSALFSRYLLFPSQKVRVLAHSNLTITGMFSPPLGYSGLVNGCLVYQPVEKISSKEMFSVVVRKASFFEGNVVGSMKRGISYGSFAYNFSGKHLFLSLPIYNTGTFFEQVTLSGILFNHLGYQRSIVVSQMIGYGTSMVLDSQVSDIPFYQGKYFFSGTISSHVIKESMVIDIPSMFAEDIVSVVVFSFFLGSWMWIGFGSCVFLCLVVVFVVVWRKYR